MNHADEAIEKVLAGLRQCDPPPAMNRRILDALQSHQDALQAQTRMKLLPRWAHGAIASFACALALAFLWVHHAPTPAPPPQTRANLQQPPSSIPTVERFHPDNPPVHLARREKDHLPHYSPAEPAETASFPAPPLPLTGQERLLLQLAHKGDTRNLAMLDAAVADKQEEQNQKQFQDFFKPPPNVLVQPDVAETPIRQSNDEPPSPNAATTDRGKQ